MKIAKECKCIFWICSFWGIDCYLARRDNQPNDLWVDPAGDAHLVYTDRNMWHAYMRDRFFPGTPITVALKYARMRNGRVVDRKTLLESEEDTRAAKPATGNAQNRFPEPRMRGPVPDWAAFQATPDGRLFVLWHQTDGKASSRSTLRSSTLRSSTLRLGLEELRPEGLSTGNVLQQLLPEMGEPVRVELARPLSSFFNTSERNGHEPSDTIDLYGLAPGESIIRYAQIRIV